MDAGRVGGGTPRRRACRTWRSPRVDNTEASPPRPPSRSRRLASFVLGRSPGTHMGWDGHAKQWRRGDAMDAYVYSRGVCASMVILVSASVHPSNADAKAGVVGRVHSAAGSVPPAVPMACLIGRVRWSMHSSSSSILFHPATAKFSGAMPMPLPVATGLGRPAGRRRTSRQRLPAVSVAARASCAPFPSAHPRQMLPRAPC